MLVWNSGRKRSPMPSFNSASSGVPVASLRSGRGPLTSRSHSSHALHGRHRAFASVTHAQAKTRLVQGKGIRVVVDRDQGLPDEPYSGKQRMRFDSGKIGWIEFKFKLELSWLTFGLITRHNCNSYAPREVSQKALKLSCLKKLNLAGKVSWNCHKMTATGERRR